MPDPSAAIMEADICAELDMFKKILVPLDGSPLAEQALGPAAAIARATHAEVDLVLVHEPMPLGAFEDAPWNAARWDDEHTYLESIVGELVSVVSAPVTHAMVRGGAVEMICRRAHEIDADLIVMTTHGRTGFSRAWLGSVADGVLRRSAVPTLMLRASDKKVERLAAYPLFARILVPLDGSALSSDILSAAKELAKCNTAKLVLLRVVQPVPLVVADGTLPGVPLTLPPTIPDEEATTGLVKMAELELAEAVSALDEAGIKGSESHVVVSPSVANAIVDFARKHDIGAIAMSTHGRGASRLLLGSVADKIVRGSDLPVLLHRPVAVAGDLGVITSATIGHQLPSLSSV